MATAMEERIAEIRREHAGSGFQAASEALASYLHNEVFDGNVNAAMERGLNELLADKATERVSQPRTKAPDFVLNDQDDVPVRLSHVLEAGPAIVVFYRGLWCPYCNLHLGQFQGRLEQIHAAGGSLIAVSPQKPDNTAETVKANGLSFPVLSDPGNAVAESFGLSFVFSEELRDIYIQFGIDLEVFNDGSGWRLPIPGTFVIDREREIVKSWVDADYKRRAEPAEVLEVLRGW